MTRSTTPRDELASRYLDLLEFDPYPAQEEALLAWFSSDSGVLVATPTGTGKTLIAEGAVYEALAGGSRCYYTTPLIALCEQKLTELQRSAKRWGFSSESIGLVTGNRRVNPDAPVLVVVAEILLNRLLQPEEFGFDDVSAVVMDEFHSFNDFERGVVWELSLGLLPAGVRLLLLSATVGNAAEFIGWLDRAHGRRLELVQSTDRRIPLEYHWVGDRLLVELIEEMATAEPSQRRTPALVFCFHRDGCWSVAEQLKGKRLVDDEQKRELAAALSEHNWSGGAGPRLKTILHRGVGVHHAGLLPKYRRVVETLFQRRLLSVVVCTETLAAGINLPARSVVMIELMKGPAGKQRLVDPSAAHQMFGRAGRPQFDTRGDVYALAHEDDVRIGKFQHRLDAIPSDTRDPNLRRARKKLEKKKPTRHPNRQYWNEEQFRKLVAADPRHLASRGSLPWRLLAHLLMRSPEVDRLRHVVDRRLMPARSLAHAQRELDAMLITLADGGFVELEPAPPEAGADASGDDGDAQPSGWLGTLLEDAAERSGGGVRPVSQTTADSAGGYRPERAVPTDRLPTLLQFRSIHPMFGSFLRDYLGVADPNERIQALECALELPGSVLKSLRVPGFDRMPPGRLATERVDPELLSRGLLTAEELDPDPEPDDFGKRRWPLALADKLRLLFDVRFPGAGRLVTRPVWAAGAVLEFGGDFAKLVSSREFARQEGILFRHLLRFILLADEFARVPPTDVDPHAWSDELQEISERLAETCRAVDPQSTDKFIEESRTGDLLAAAWSR